MNRTSPGTSLVYTLPPIVILLAVLAILVTGCATAERAQFGGAKMEAPAPAAGAADRSENAASVSGQMIVSTAFLTVEVDDIEHAVGQIVETAKRNGGYIVSSGNTTVIRVAARSLAAALEEITGLGKVTAREIREQDVAKQYSDTSIRLENAQAARARYLELLAKAEDVEAALKVEKELERLNGEISLLESDLGNLAHLVQYATINVNLAKRVTPGPLGWIFYGLYRAIEWLFVWY
jgi:hypothetical protein